MSASSYLPLLVGLAAPFVVLGFIWATRRALESLRQKRAERRASRDPSMHSRSLPKRIAVVLGIATILVVAAALAVFDRPGRAQIVSGSGATLPTTSVREPGTAARPDQDTRPEKDTRDSDRRRAKPVAVSVVNAAGVQGLAATKSSLLRRRGFKVKGTGTALSRREESVVFFKEGKALDARRVSRAIRINSRETNDRQIAAWGQKAGVVVMLGRDAANTRVRQASTAPSTLSYGTP
jgi:hypothetical protein